MLKMNEVMCQQTKLVPRCVQLEPCIFFPGCDVLMGMSLHIITACIHLNDVDVILSEHPVPCTIKSIIYKGFMIASGKILMML